MEDLLFEFSEIFTRFYVVLEDGSGDLAFADLTDQKGSGIFH